MVTALPGISLIKSFTKNLPISRISQHRSKRFQKFEKNFLTNRLLYHLKPLKSGKHQLEYFMPFPPHTHSHIYLFVCVLRPFNSGHLETAPPFTVPCKGREAW